VTNGLLKIDRTSWVPAIPGTPAIPAQPEKWWLAPPPPGYYYAFKDSTWSLKKYDPPGLSGSWSDDGSYTMPDTGGVVLRPGDTYKVVYKKTGEPNITYTGTVPAGPFTIPWPPGDGWEMVSLTITPAGSGGGSQPPAQLSNVPPPASAIMFNTATYSNGYPTGPGPYTGVFRVPNAGGGYTDVTRTYTKTGPNGLFVPEPGVTDPAGVLTTASGVRAVLVAPFAGAPATPTIPGYTVIVPSNGWNAGANSIAELDGDLYVRFQIPNALGARVGFFTGGTRDSTDLDALQAGFYIYSDAAGARWSIIDQGRQVVLDSNAHGPSTYYEIRRVSGQISYVVDDEVRWRSPVLLEGALRVGTTLYSPGDMVL
jgi:hypothetical protein